MLASPRRRRAPIRWAFGLIFLIAGCERPEDPVAPPSGARVETDADVLASGSFYYYQGERIELDVDPSRMIVASSLADAVASAAVVLEGFGIQVVNSETLVEGTVHHLLDLSGNLTRTMAAVEALRLTPGIDFATPGYVTRTGADTLLFVNRLVVDFAADVGTARIDSLIEATGTRVLRPPRPDSGFFQYRLAYPPGSDPLKVAQDFDRHPMVDWADPDRRARIYLFSDPPSDPYYSLQYYFKNNENPGIDINIEPAWEITLGGGIPSAGGIWVAVIDDGVDANHADLDDAVSSGYAYDAINGTHIYAMAPRSQDSHGTNVSGIIAAQHDGQGIAGGAPGVNLVPIRIYSNFDGNATPAEVADAINYAWYYVGVDVINNSWGGGSPSNAITDAINDAVADGRNGAGTTVVFAAGNCGSRAVGNYCSAFYPGYLPSVIGVGAIDRDGDPSDYTPRDDAIDIVAPSGHYAHRAGVHCDTRGDVVTTELNGTDACNDGPNGDNDYTENFTGTSASAPQVAVAAILLISADASLTEPEVRQRILDTATYWGNPDDFGEGKLNAGAAVRLMVAIDGPSSVGLEETCTWTAEAVGGLPPYDFEWYRNNSFVGTGDSYTADTGTSDFLLRIDVTDSQSTIRSEDLMVTVSGQPMCDA